MSNPVTKQSILRNMSVNLFLIRNHIDDLDLWKLDKMPSYEPISVNSKTGVIFYWPDKIGIDKVGGYKLKDNKGFISMSETYIYTNDKRNRMTKIAHVYKYIASDTYYLASNAYNKPEALLNYNFHYDKDLDYDLSRLNDEGRHPNYHIQVLHSHPRFATDQTLVADFISMVSRTCFQDNGEAFKMPMYLINSVV